MVARVVYETNQTMDSTALTVIVRNPAPTVTVGTETPPAGGWVAPASIPLIARVTTQGNLIAKVQFLGNGVVVGEDSTAPYTLTWPNVTVGTRSVVARVFYESNKTVDSTTVNVVVVRSPPTVAVSAGTPPAGEWMAPAIIPLSATVTSQGNTITKVQFLADGVVLGEDATAPYVLTWPKVTLGTRSVVARVFYRSNQTRDSAPTSVVVVNPPPTAVTSGLVAHYPFNGNANDESGNRRHGTVEGPLLTLDRFGRTDAAYRFNGSSQKSGKPNRITTPQGSSFANGFSASVWITGSTDLQPESYIFGSGRDGSRWIGLRADQRPATSLGKRVLQIEGLTSLGSKSTPDPLRSPVQMEFLADGARWYHVVVTVGGGRMSVFIDGNLSDFVAVGTLKSPSSGRIVIGSFEDAITGKCWNGCIDDVRFYNRTLTESDIRILYDYESKGSLPTMGSGGFERSLPSQSNLPLARRSNLLSASETAVSDSCDALVQKRTLHTAHEVLSEESLQPAILSARVVEISGSVVLDVVAEEGADVWIETATDLLEWHPTKRIRGGGHGNPVRILMVDLDQGVSGFWRARVP